METKGLPEKVFKIMFIKMLMEDRRAMQCENFKKEIGNIRKHQSNYRAEDYYNLAIKKKNQYRGLIVD